MPSHQERVHRQYQESPYIVFQASSMRRWYCGVTDTGDMNIYDPIQGYAVLTQAPDGALTVTLAPGQRLTVKEFHMI